MNEEEEDKAGVNDDTVGQLAQLNDLIELHPELGEDEDIKGLATIVNNTSTELDDEDKDDEDDEEDPYLGDEEEEEEDQEEEEEGDEEDEEEEEEEEEDEYDPFEVNGKGKKNSVEVDFKLDKEAKKFLKDRYAIGDESTFFNSVDKWRTDSQKMSEAVEQSEELVEGLQGLPQNLKDAINAYASGEDYHQAFGSPDRINFGLDFEDQDIDDIAGHYYKDDYNEIIKDLDDDEIEEDEAEKAIKKLAGHAERAYNSDKKSIDVRRAKYVNDEQDRIKSLKSSASSSVESLKKELPNFKSSDLQRIKKILVDGTVEDQIYNDDGSVKPGAAKMVALLLHSDDILKREKGIAKNKGKSEANIEHVKKGKKKLKQSKSTAAAQKERKAHDAVSHLDQHFAEDPYS